jgi:hypothetical protein
MIDLEEALAPLVERAPAPPAVETVARRGRRHRRRRAVTLVAALVLVAVAAVGAIAAVAGRDEPRVADVPGAVDHVRVTLLDGSQLDISGPASLGLTELPLSFNAELVYTDDAPLGYNPSNSFTVVAGSSEIAGPVIALYMTGDNRHPLRVYEVEEGYVGVVHYDGWSLLAYWNARTFADWSAFANALTGRVGTDGNLVVTPSSGWNLGPTDSPDVRIGDYAFFGPAHDRCRADVLTAGEQCNGEGTVMYRALDPALGDTLDDIDVAYTPPPDG